MEKETEGDSKDTVTNGIFQGRLEELALPWGGRGCARELRAALQIPVKCHPGGYKNDR